MKICAGKWDATIRTFTTATRRTNSAPSPVQHAATGRYQQQLLSIISTAYHLRLSTPPIPSKSVAQFTFYQQNTLRGTRGLLPLWDHVLSSVFNMQPWDPPVLCSARSIELQNRTLFCMDKCFKTAHSIPFMSFLEGGHINTRSY